MEDSSPIRPEEVLVAVVNYNQALEIQNFLTELQNVWPKDRSLVVDDGSSDESPEIARRLNYNLLVHSTNRGVGAAIRTAILYAHHKKIKAIVIMSSNGKMNPQELQNLLKPLLEGRADYMTGSRFILGGSFPGLTPWRRIAIPIFSLVATVLLLKKFSDITCGYRAYKIDFLFSGGANIEQPWLDRYEMEYYIHFWACKNGLRILESPVTIRYKHLQKHRKSKIRLSDYWSIIKPLILLRLGLKK